jgi:hypothetical protein
MTLREIGVSIAPACAASSALAADVTDRWNAAIAAQQGNVELVFDLKSEGGKVTGTDRVQEFIHRRSGQSAGRDRIQGQPCQIGWEER